MRFVDKDEEVINGTKKLGGGTKLCIMQSKRNRRLGNTGYLETLRNSIWKPKDLLRQHVVTAHILSAWMAFHDFLPAVTNIGI